MVRGLFYEYNARIKQDIFKQAERKVIYSHSIVAGGLDVMS